MQFFFQYIIGNFVRLLPQDSPTQRVIWRGKQVVPSLTGRPYEVAVYRLDNGHWDCYYEHELRAALRADESEPEYSVKMMQQKVRSPARRRRKD